MTLEVIKKQREKDKNAYWQPVYRGEDIDWLISEVEHTHKIGAAIEKVTAARCAEIANNKIKHNIKYKITGGSFNEGCAEVYEDIRKEFNL